MFIGLHRHSHYSKRDAIAKVPDIVNRIGELGQSAWALTDHGTTSGLMDAYKSTKKYNKEHGTAIKFIFGCEMYWIPNVYIKDRNMSCHLLVLAKNQTGYRNLLRLVTRGYGDKGKLPDQYFYTMRVTNDDLKEFHKGLIVTSACIGGVLNPCKIDDGTNIPKWDKNLAYERATAFKGIFGNDFYLEIQCAKDVRQIEYNKRILQMGKDLSIPVFVSEDSHYVLKSEAYTHRKWLGIDLEPDNPNAYYQTDDYYIHSEKEIRESLSYLPKDTVDSLIDNTVRIADKCEQVEIDTKHKHYPKFDVPEGETPLSQMCKIVSRGWKKKIEGKVDKSLYPKYKEQIDHEIHVLDKIGYTNYMLMTEDFISACHEKGIRTGVARGSVGGCLVAYLMDITRIDPLKYGLIFERFAHDKRSSSADIDTDLPNSRRGEAIQYLVDKYHEVYHIRTINYMAERAAIQRAAKSLGYEPSQIRNLPKTIEEQVDGELKDLASKYIGIIQSYGCHASAIMLFPSDPTEWCAIEKQGNDYVCAYEYHDLEDMGLLKEDLLGIKTLDVIDDCVEMVKQNYGICLDMDNLPDDDEKTFKMLCNDDVLGCFQIESDGMKKIIKGEKPKNVYDLVPLVALYRPSTIQSGKVEEFIELRNGQKPVTYLHPWLEKSLKETYGIMLYQEQAMKIVQDMAGYDLGRADVFRRAIGRKIPEEMKRLIPEFVKDCEKRGVSEKVAKQVAEWLSNAAAYQFNKSHSAAYGYTCYETAYLKSHFPVEYYCAYLNAYKGDKQSKLLEYINDAKKHGIEILPPDVRSDTCDWQVVDKDGKKALRMAINYIYQVGNIPVPLNKDSYQKLPKDKVENLIKAGAMDCFGKRQKLLNDLYEHGEIEKLQKRLEVANERQYKNHDIWESAREGTKKKAEAYQKMLKYGNQKHDILDKIEEVKRTCNKEYDEQAGEIEVLGMTFRNVFDGYDLSKYQEPETDEDGHVAEKSFDKRIVLGIVRRIKHWKQHNGKPMMFFSLECPSGKTYDLVMFNYCYTDLSLNKVYTMVVQGNKFKRLIG